MIPQQFWVGPIGRMRQLPMIPVGATWSGTISRTQGEHESLTGAVTVDIQGPVRRSWDMAWSCLDPGEIALVRSLYLGLLGSSLRLIDPAQRNHLDVDGSTGGGGFTGAGAFTTTAGTLTVVPAVLDLPVSTAISTSTGTTLTGRPVPTVAGGTFTAWVKGTGTVSLRMSHRDPAGAELSVTTGPDILLTGAWQELTLPVTTVTAQAAPRLVATQAINTTGWQWPTPGVWEPGLGCPLVFPVEHRNNTTGLGTNTPSLTLREL